MGERTGQLHLEFRPLLLEWGRGGIDYWIRWGAGGIRGGLSEEVTFDLIPARYRSQLGTNRGKGQMRSLQERFKGSKAASVAQGGGGGRMSQTRAQTHRGRPWGVGRKPLSEGGEQNGMIDSFRSLGLLCGEQTVGGARLAAGTGRGGRWGRLRPLCYWRNWRLELAWGVLLVRLGGVGQVKNEIHRWP